MGRLGFGWSQTDTSGPDQRRARLVAELRDSARVTDPRVLAAFGRVPRHRFVPEARRALAYEDRALPLFEQQTISQPSMIAIMLDGLHCAPDDCALEVGAGCGYAAALLGQLVSRVHGIELRPNLVALARHTLADLGIANVAIHQGDGRRGLPEHGPFQRILVSAAAEQVPSALLDQLNIGGRIAIPVNSGAAQTLMIGERRSPSEVTWTKSVPCLWVPLVGG